MLSKGSGNLQAVSWHFDYISRQGGLALEGDDGWELHGQAGKELVEDWDLDIDELRPQMDRIDTRGSKPMKLVHKLVFSMPEGTPPQKVLSAVRNFAREEFYSQHRYAMVLHTDEPHPHVHLVLRALSDEGKRLNIKKATLRHWRSQFAQHLRAQGVAANATERAVRGESRKPMKDGIYRASQRGDSTYTRGQAESVARELVGGEVRPESGKRTLLETRVAIQRGWQVVADKLAQQGDSRLAADVIRFAGNMARPLTDREWIARGLLAQVRARQREVRTL